MLCWVGVSVVVVTEMVGYEVCRCCVQKRWQRRCCVPQNWVG